MFAHEYGVDLTAISWQHEPQFLVPPAVAANYRITPNRSGRLLDDLLIDGEIDAYIGARISDAAQRSLSVQRLWPDYKERERDYFRRTRLFPIMHTIAIRRDVYERDPFVARSLFDALIAAKEIARSKMRYLGTLRYMLPWMFAEIEEVDAVFGRDPFVDGLEPNRPELEMTLKYLREQALLDRPVTLEDAFADVGC